MNGPDGLEQRTADLEERSERESDRIEALEDRAEGQVDEALIDIAQAKMMSWALDRVFTEKPL